MKIRSPNLKSHVIDSLPDWVQPWDMWKIKDAPKKASHKFCTCYKCQRMKSIAKWKQTSPVYHHYPVVNGVQNPVHLSPGHRKTWSLVRQDSFSSQSNVWNLQFSKAAEISRADLFFSGKSSLLAAEAWSILQKTATFFVAEKPLGHHSWKIPIETKVLMEKSSK